MKRRLFLLSGTASAAFVLTGCGGGGGGGTSAAGGGAAAAGAAGPVSSSQFGSSSGTSTPVESGSGYPFGSRRVPYAAGIRPSKSNEEMDAWCKSAYDSWKSKLVVNADSVVPGGYAVKFSTSAFMTVSEGMGYGMLLAVLFAGHDPNARQLFDGLLAVVRTRYAYGVAAHDPGGKYLMDWRLYPDGSSAGEGWNAMDGDLDMAMALLMADKQWGSNGSWNYLQEAKNTINAMKSWNFAPDGTSKGLRLPHVSRTSDYMIGHFRAFQSATGDSFWSKAIDRSLYLTELMQSQFSPGVGLVPDFIIYSDSNPMPSTGGFGDGNNFENLYYWNACRNPWRYASDYVLSGDNRWKTVTVRMMDFFKSRVDAGGISAIGCGYQMDGTQTASGDSAAFIAPVMLGGCVDAKYQGLVDAGWDWNAAHPIPGYYDGEIQLLSMVVASGNWWTP